MWGVVLKTLAVTGGIVVWLAIVSCLAAVLLGGGRSDPRG